VEFKLHSVIWMSEACFLRPDDERGFVEVWKHGFIGADEVDEVEESGQRVDVSSESTTTTIILDEPRVVRRLPHKHTSSAR